jgi:MinD-like ATPase involved in chromosome partitioning or flagellar assembly
MTDQANDLRRLLQPEPVRDDSPRPAGRPRPRLLAVTGGKGGVGATTAALNLATAMARGGTRTLLVDADPRGGDAAALCGLETDATLEHVIRGRRALADVLQQGPAGLAVVAGPWASDCLAECSDEAPRRLLREIWELESRFEMAIVDAGRPGGRLWRRLCEAADALLLVTSTEPIAVQATYAAMKRLRHQSGGQSLHVLVNRARSQRQAAEMQRRLRNTCRRCLGLAPEMLAALPVDRRFARAATRRVPPLAGNARGTAAKRLARAAEGLRQRRPASGRGAPQPAPAALAWAVLGPSDGRAAGLFGWLAQQLRNARRKTAKSLQSVNSAQPVVSDSR